MDGIGADEVQNGGLEFDHIVLKRTAEKIKADPKRVAREVSERMDDTQPFLSDLAKDWEGMMDSEFEPGMMMWGMVSGFAVVEDQLKARGRTVPVITEASDDKVRQWGEKYLKGTDPNAPAIEQSKLLVEGLYSEYPQLRGVVDELTVASPFREDFEAGLVITVPRMIASVSEN